MKKYYLVFVGFALFQSFQAKAQSQPEIVEAEAAMKALGSLFGGGSTNAAIHFRQLKELLPVEYNGMKRSNTEAGKNAAFGMNIAYAQAEYVKDESQISIKISDISSMGSFIRMAQFAWTQNEVEKESDDGYERTGKVDGHPSQERYEYSGKSGKLDVLVADRFTIEASGQGVEMDEIKGLLKAIDLNRLATLKPEAN